MKSTKQIALFLGIIASLFFAITFIVNRLMAALPCPAVFRQNRIAIKGAIV